jgi:ABC-type glycerol-3-phosphate transport system permease component
MDGFGDHRVSNQRQHCSPGRRLHKDLHQRFRAADAVRLDGADTFTIIFRVLAPIARPTLVAFSPFSLAGSKFVVASVLATFIVAQRHIARGFTVTSPK